MPHRSPPAHTPAASKQYSASDSDLSSVEKTESVTVNITQRPKRKRDDDLLDNLNTFMKDMKDMFTQFKSDQDSKFLTLSSTVSEIRTQNSEIKTSIEFISKKYDEVIVKMDQLQVECTNQKSYIDSLENRLDQVERKSLSASIELRNIPKMAPENRDTLTTVIQNLGNFLEIPIQKSDIREVYRLKEKPNKVSPVIVHFTTLALKESLLRHMRNYNTEHKDNKLNTVHLRVDGPSRPVYLSEHLTSKARRLYFLAREFAKEYSYSHCWTSYGRVYLRRRDGEPRLLIDCENILTKLRPAK